MASFVEDLRLGNTPDYSNKSGGPIRTQSNDAFGTLFKGVGEVLDTGFKAVDNENQKQIDSSLYKGIDEIRNAQGVDAAVQANTPSSQSLFDPTKDGSTAATPSAAPPGIDTATSEVARFAQARADGRISDTYFYSRVEALVRQVRSRYPGYREEIDKKVSSIVGTTPANALRSALLADITKSQTQAQKEKDDWRRYVDQNMGDMPPSLRQRAVAGEDSPEFRATVRNEVGQRKFVQQERSNYTAELEADAAKGRYDERKAVEYAGKTANGLVNDSFNDALDAGTRGQSLMASIQKLQGKTPTPEELIALKQQFGQFRLNLSNKIDSAFAQNWSADSTNSYASKIQDPGKLKSIKEAAMSRVNDMETALTNGDWGVFAANANAAKASKEAAVRQVLETNDAARTITTMREVFGPEVTTLYLNGTVGGAAGMKTLSDAATAINNLSKGQVGTGQKKMSETLDQQKSANVRDRGAATRALIQDTAETLANPTTPAPAVKNLVGGVYEDPALMNKFSDAASKQEVFNRLTNPGISNNLSKGKESDPTNWDSYRKWAGNNFYNAYQGDIASIKEFKKSANQNGIDIQVGPTGRLVVTQKANTGEGWVMAGGARARFQEFSEIASKMNVSITNMEAIAKAGGEKVIDALAPLYAEMGLSPQGAQEDKKPGNAEGASVQKSSFMSAPQPLMSTPPTDTIQLSGDPEDTIDLNQQEVRRARNMGQSDPNWQSAGGVVPPTADLKTALTAAATELGTTPQDLATVISYETGGTFDPGIRGGAGNRHIGLIQFGANEQQTYGARQDQSVGEQMQAVVRYLKHRGFKPGMDILDLYSTINAGAPGLYNRSDAGNGGAPGTVRDKVNNQMSRHRRKAEALFSS